MKSIDIDTMNAQVPVTDYVGEDGLLHCGTCHEAKEERFPEGFRLLGGSDKHCDFTPLAREIVASPWIRETVLIGVTANQIEDTLRRCGWNAIRRAGSMAEAVRLCSRIAAPGWNALLSPACASFDMFRDYEERGRVFKQLVAELPDIVFRTLRFYPN